MFRKIEDFKKEWEIEAKATAEFIRTLTPASLSQSIDGTGGRTLGRLGWHITTAIGELMNRTGLNVDCPHDDGSSPSDPNVIADQYEKTSKSLLDEVTSKWDDDKLLLQDDMYGQQWYKGESLLNLITHQAHHRGQMMVLARQAGLTPQLGVYGPTREAWKSMGMEALA